jgi:transposase-like protein
MSPEQNLEPSKNRRRRWSESEKLAILKEADESSFSEAARQNQISTALIFSWRKNLQGAAPTDADQFEPEPELMVALARNDSKLNKIDQVCNKLLADLNSGKLTAYNAANAYSSLTKAFTAVQSQRFEIVDRLVNLLTAGEQVAGTAQMSAVDFEIEREAERLCYAMVKKSVEQKRAANAASRLTTSE